MGRGRHRTKLDHRGHQQRHHHDIRRGGRHAHAQNDACDPVQARKDFIARQAMGRLAQAEEIAPIVVYLASDESIFASGQVFARAAEG